MALAELVSSYSRYYLARLQNRELAEEWRKNRLNFLDAGTKRVTVTVTPQEKYFSCSFVTSSSVLLKSRLTPR